MSFLTRTYPFKQSKHLLKDSSIFGFIIWVILYFLQPFGLYTSRVVLQTLGVEDYGIYGVVGGIVAMMGFLNASMSGATSRFLTFELGRGDKERLSKTFSSALVGLLDCASQIL